MLFKRGLIALGSAWFLASTPAPAAAATTAALQAAPAFNFAVTPTQIAADCTREIGRQKSRIDAIAAVPKAQRAFATVVLALENADADAYDALAADLFLSQVSPDKSVREAASKCDVEFTNYNTQESARPDLYAALRDADASGTAKSDADKKILELALVGAKRSGAALDEPQRQKYLALEAKLTAARDAYKRNINETNPIMHFTAAQLAGLPAYALASYKREGDAYLVPVSEANFAVFMRGAALEATRKEMYYGLVNKSAALNAPLFRQVLELRRAIAHLLGYSSWAQYTLADRMAGTPQKVDAFLHDLDAALLPKAREEAGKLTALKAQETKDPSARLEPWDVPYYTAALKRTQYQLDPATLRAYFPVAKTVPAILGIYSKILSVTFTKRADPAVWDKSVQAFAVKDARSGTYLGELYLDLFPRDGKDAHFHSSGFLPHRVLADGTVRPAVNAIVGEFPEPAAGQPALLSHDEAVTFFHEFGHAMAGILATAPYESLSSGFRWDFVEAPSQMLENWVWDPQILKEISSNVTTGAPLPDELIAKMRATRSLDESALFWVRQIALAAADMTWHEKAPSSETDKVYAQAYTRLTPIAYPNDLHFETNFDHIVGGAYSAGYYGYLWSKVYAQDMFTQFASNGLESPAIGMLYRTEILEPARTFEPDVLVKRFLGRPLDPSAFYKTLGLNLQ